MNSPEEKAQDLYNKFFDCDEDTPVHDQGFMSVKLAKYAALICVDEILAEHTNHNAVNWANQREERKEYWQKVKDCISKL